MPDFEVGFVPFPEIAGGDGPRLDLRRRLGLVHHLERRASRRGGGLHRLPLLAGGRRRPGSAVRATSCRSQVDLSDLELGPLYQQIIDTLQSAEAEGAQFGYNVDVLAPPEFNDMMFSGFQAILVGDKTPEQQAADLQAAWEEGMAGMEATPAP